MYPHQRQPATVPREFPLLAGQQVGVDAGPADVVVVRVPAISGLLSFPVTLPTGVYGALVSL
jgi:hypothetical protein